MRGRASVSITEGWGSSTLYFMYSTPYFVIYVDFGLGAADPLVFLA